VALKTFEEFKSDFNSSQKLTEGAIGNMLLSFKNWAAGFWKKTPEAKKIPKAPPPSYLIGEHILYIPHQQGPDAAAKIFKAASGLGKLDPDIRKKLLVNVPTGSSYYNVIKDPKKTSKQVAVAFLKYYSENWNSLKKEALNLIIKPEYKKAKLAIDSIQNLQLPKDFLTTVAFKESSLNPNPSRNKKYRGLFQIGPLAWAELKRVMPFKYKGNQIPLDPKKNAQAGHDYLKHTNDIFQKKLQA
jgi:soluble lytic murein transglycosylase-like protein